jgi:hypothetical protein
MVGSSPYNGHYSVSKTASSDYKIFSRSGVHKCRKLGLPSDKVWCPEAPDICLSSVRNLLLVSVVVSRFLNFVKP